MTRYGITLLTVGLVLFVSQARADDKEDKEKLQGEWSLASVELNGKSQKIPGAMYKFEGNKVYASRTGVEEAEGSFDIDSSKKPKTLDMTGKGQLLKAIYELDGDTLKICMPGGSDLPRPTEFKSAEKVMVMTLKRVKK